MCILSLDVVKNILENYSTHEGFQSMHMNEKNSKFVIII
jgi:hypothetical protein